MATKHVRSNTAQGLIAVQMDFGLSYVTLAQAQVLCAFYGAKMLGRESLQADKPCVCSSQAKTGRRIMVKR